MAKKTKKKSARDPYEEVLEELTRGTRLVAIRFKRDPNYRGLDLLLNYPKGFAGVGGHSIYVVEESFLELLDRAEIKYERRDPTGKSTDEIERLFGFVVRQ